MATERLGILSTGLDRHSSYYDEGGILYQTVAERLPSEMRTDTITHICKGGEYLIDLACRYYARYTKDPVDFYMIIAQFQEDPIIDPLAPLETGQIIHIPSMEFINEVAFGESLEEDPEI
jgi:hypothetical protein